jgi:hypothetical protein
MECNFGTCTEKLKNLLSSPEKSRSLLRQGAGVRISSSLPRRRQIPPPGIRVMMMCAWLGVSTPGFAGTTTPSRPTGRSAAPGSFWSCGRQQRSLRAPQLHYLLSTLRSRSAVTQALRSTTAQRSADRAPQPSVHDEPVPAHQPAHGFAVHAQPARQELSNERR